MSQRHGRRLIRRPFAREGGWVEFKFSLNLWRGLIRTVLREDIDYGRDEYNGQATRGMLPKAMPKRAGWRLSAQKATSRIGST